MVLGTKLRHRTTVEYAVRESNQPIGVTTYKVSPNLPEGYKNYLPSAETIAKSLAGILGRDYESTGNLSDDI